MSAADFKFKSAVDDCEISLPDGHGLRDRWLCTELDETTTNDNDNEKKEGKKGGKQGKKGKTILARRSNIIRSVRAIESGDVLKPVFRCEGINNKLPRAHQSALDNGYSPG